MTRKTIKVNPGASVPTGAIKRIDVGINLGLTTTKKFPLKIKTVKGIKPPGDRPRNYSSPTQ